MQDNGSPSHPCEEQAMVSNQEAHYDDVAKEYNKAWFYEDGTDYQRWLVRSLQTRLQAAPDSRVVDMGGGTGNFSAAFYRECELEEPVLCVDPSRALLAQAQRHVSEVEPLLADGLSFVGMTAYNQAYDRILFKEVVHHFPRDELGVVFAGTFQQLRPGGRLVVMTRPHDSTHYPFFHAAHQTWKAVQQDETIYAQELRTAGFDVSVDHADYTVTMPLSRWLSMVESRFWSTLHGFSDAEMAEGLKEIKARFLGDSQSASSTTHREQGDHKGEALRCEERNDPPISFPDRLVFITGRKA